MVVFLVKKGYNFSYLNFWSKHGYIFGGYFFIVILLVVILLELYFTHTTYHTYITYTLCLRAQYTTQTQHETHTQHTPHSKTNNLQTQILNTHWHSVWNRCIVNEKNVVWDKKMKKQTDKTQSWRKQILFKCCFQKFLSLL